MPPAGFELSIPAGERLQTLALDRSATGIGLFIYITLIKIILKLKWTSLLTHTMEQDPSWDVKSFSVCSVSEILLPHLQQPITCRLDPILIYKNKFHALKVIPLRPTFCIFLQTTLYSLCLRTKTLCIFLPHTCNIPWPAQLFDMFTWVTHVEK